MDETNLESVHPLDMNKARSRAHPLGTKPHHNLSRSWGDYSSKTKNVKWALEVKSGDSGTVGFRLADRILAIVVILLYS